MVGGSSSFHAPVSMSVHKEEREWKHLSFVFLLGFIASWLICMNNFLLSTGASVALRHFALPSTCLCFIALMHVAHKGGIGFQQSRHLRAVKPESVTVFPKSSADESLLSDAVSDFDSASSVGVKTVCTGSSLRAFAFGCAEICSSLAFA